MKRILQLVVVAAGLAASLAAQAKVDVNVGVTIREPGVYGRIEVGTAPPPPVYHPQPVIIQQVPVVVGQPVVVQQPVYLYAPPGHQKKWRKHCHKYNACGQPVYFVKEDWVRQSYQQANPGWQPPPSRTREPVMSQDHGKGGGHQGKGQGKEHGKGQGKGKNKDD
jgi:hypothetical protein